MSAVASPPPVEKPVAAPAPAPAAAPSPAPSAAPADHVARQDAEIDALLSTPEPPKAAEPAAVTPPPPKKEPAVTTPPTKPAAQVPAKPKVEGIDVLRTERDRLKAEHATATADLTRLQSELAEARKNGEATGALTKQYAAAQKELEETRQELARARYTPSDKVKAAQGQLKNAANQARPVITSLEVTRDDGTTAPASWDEFQRLCTMTDAEGKPAHGAAIKAIKAMFGEDKDVAMAQYWKVSEALQGVESAETEDRKGFQERVQQATADTATKREQFQGLVKEIHNDIVSKNADLFGPDPTDTEGNELLAKGHQVANLLPGFKANDGLSVAQKAKVLATAYNRVAAWPRLVARMTKANATIAELRAKVAEYEGGAQPPQRPGGAEPAPKEEGWEDEFDKNAASFEAR